MLSIYDVSLNIRGKDSNNLLISFNGSVYIFLYLFSLDLAFCIQNEIFPSIILVCSQMLRVWLDVLILITE